MCEYLRNNTVQLSLSATVLEDTLIYIITNSSFRPIYLTKPFYIKILRGSINRIDIKYIFKTISKDKLLYGNIDILYFITQGAINSKGRAILEGIRKFLGFLKGRKLI